MQPLKTYDIATVVQTLGTIFIDGASLGEDGGVTFEGEGLTRFTEKVGAGGQVTVSRNNDKRVRAKLTLMETSKFCKPIDDLVRAQALPGPVLPCVYSMVDLITGDSINEPFAVITETPGPSKAKEAGMREWTILLPNGAETLRLGQTS